MWVLGAQVGTHEGMAVLQCGKGNQRLIKASLTPSQYTLMGQQEP